MGLAVDPAREPRDDDQAGGRELSPEQAGDLRAVGRAGAGADDRDRGPVEQLGGRLAAQEEAGRRVEDRAEGGRERGVRAGDESQTASLERSEEGRCIEAAREALGYRSPAELSPK